ncbi:MAG: ABC transporter permease [Candidatus Dormibacterales bacterium]
MQILRNVTRHKLRSFLTISGIVIGVLALTTMGALAENFNALIDGGVTYFGGSITVGPPDGEAAALLPLSKIDDIKQVPGVAAAFPSYGFSAKPGSVVTVSFGIPDQIVAGDPPRTTGAPSRSATRRATLSTPSHRGRSCSARPSTRSSTRRSVTRSTFRSSLRTPNPTSSTTRFGSWAS